VKKEVKTFNLKTCPSKEQKRKWEKSKNGQKEVVSIWIFGAYFVQFFHLTRVTFQ
jgi:hypothetical protein